MYAALEEELLRLDAEPHRVAALFITSPSDRVAAERLERLEKKARTV